MYVIEHVLNKRNIAFLFALFTILSSLGMGCMIQSNSISNILNKTYNIPNSIIGIFIVLICSYVIFGGIKRIAKISAVVVPIASITYILMCTYIIYINRDNLYNSIYQIIYYAFNDYISTASGIAGFSIAQAINTGISKGLFSNEAGMGSSPIIDISVETEDISIQSNTAGIGVVIDTVIMCTLSGITYIISDPLIQYKDAMEIISNTFSQIPLIGNILLIITLTIFVIATIPGWAYYAEKAYEYITTFDKRIYKLTYVVLIYIGAITSIEIVWNISSIANALMILPNLYMLFCLRDEIR